MFRVPRHNCRSTTARALLDFLLGSALLSRSAPSINGSKSCARGKTTSFVLPPALADNCSAVCGLLHLPKTGDCSVAVCGLLHLPKTGDCSVAVCGLLHLPKTDDCSVAVCRLLYLPETYSVPQGRIWSDVTPVTRGATLTLKTQIKLAVSSSHYSDTGPACPITMDSVTGTVPVFKSQV